MDGVDLAWEVKQRWPFLPMVLTSGHPRERVGQLPPGVAYMRKPWQPLNVLIAAERALASPPGRIDETKPRAGAAIRGIEAGSKPTFGYCLNHTPPT